MKQIEQTNIDRWRKEAWQIAKDHGFHDTKKSTEHWKCLIITEISEAVNADRKNINASQHDVDALISRYKDMPASEFNAEFKKTIKDTTADELADVAIRIMDFAEEARLNLNIKRWGSIDDIAESASRSGKTFTEYAYSLMSDIVNVGLEWPLVVLIAYCKQNGIDLYSHIELKMHYNRFRPLRNGKAY